MSLRVTVLASILLVGGHLSFAFGQLNADNDQQENKSWIVEQPEFLRNVPLKQNAEDEASTFADPANENQTLDQPGENDSTSPSDSAQRTSTSPVSTKVADDATIYWVSLGVGVVVVAFFLLLRQSRKDPFAVTVHEHDNANRYSASQRPANATKDLSPANSETPAKTSQFKRTNRFQVDSTNQSSEKTSNTLHQQLTARTGNLIEDDEKPVVAKQLKSPPTTSLAPSKSIQHAKKTPSSNDRERDQDLDSALKEAEKRASQLIAQTSKIISLNRSLYDKQHDQNQLLEKTLAKLEASEAQVAKLKLDKKSLLTDLEKARAEPAPPDPQQRQDFENALAELKELQTSLKQSNANLANAEGKVAQLTKQLDTKTEKANALEAECKNLKQDLNSAKKKRQQTEKAENESLKKAQQLQADTSARNKTLENELRELRTRATDAEEKLAEFDRLQADHKKLLKELDQSNWNLAQLEQDNDKKQNQLNLQVTEFQTQLEDAQQRISELEADKKQVEVQLEESNRSDSENRAAITAAKAENDRLNAEISKLKDQLDDAIAEADARAEEKLRRSKMDELETADAEAYADKLKAKLVRQAKLRRETEKMLAEAERQRAELATALKSLKSESK